MEHTDICTVVLCSHLNMCMLNRKFPRNLKYADITPTFKKSEYFLKFCQLKSMRKFYMRKYMNTLIKYFQNIYLVSALSSTFVGKIKTSYKVLCTGILVTVLKVTDLSSAFGFSKNSLALINDYLSNRK